CIFQLPAMSGLRGLAATCMRRSLAAPRSVPLRVGTRPPGGALLPPPAIPSMRPRACRRKRARSPPPEEGLRALARPCRRLGKRSVSQRHVAGRTTAAGPPMLDAMRRGALNWGAKILLGILTIAFAIWGVADVFRGYGRGTIAKLGGTEISADDFRQAYEDEIAAISRRLGRRLTPAQIKLLGIEQRALARLVGSAALDAHARQLHLPLSDAAVADLIRGDPAFRGPTGTFSRQTFQSMVHQMGFSEARYVAERRREEIRDQLKDTLLEGAVPPPETVELVHNYRAEARRIDYVTPDFDKLITVPEPDDGKLKETYEANKHQFSTPELTRINVL